MYNETLIECIRCNTDKPVYEYEIYSMDRRYKICKVCREEEAKTTEAQREKIPWYVAPETVNSWPFYGSGDKFPITPPPPYYDQMERRVGIIRSGYKLVRMSNKRYRELRGLFTKYGLTNVPFPARLDIFGVAVWNDRIENSAVAALYSLGLYATNKIWEERRQARIEKIGILRVKAIKERELKAAIAEAIKLSWLDKKSKEQVLKAESKHTVDRIVKARRAKIDALGTPNLDMKTKDAIINAKSEKEVKTILKIMRAKLKALDIPNLPKEMQEEIKEAKTVAIVDGIIKAKKAEQRLKEKEKADAKKKVEAAQRVAMKKAEVAQRIAMKKQIAEQRAKLKKQIALEKKIAMAAKKKARKKVKKEKKL